MTRPPVIETERLRLRAIGTSDVDELVAMQEHEEVSRFLGPIDRPYAEERLRVLEREWAERGIGMFAVLDAVTGRFRGRVGFKYWAQFEETEIGWVLRRDAWGHGYATEAARACLDWGFAAEPRAYFTAMIHPDNSASLRVASRRDMEPLRSDVLYDSPVIVHAVSGEGWSAHRSR